MKKSRAKEIEERVKDFCKRNNKVYSKGTYRMVKKMYMESKDRPNFFTNI